MQAACLFIFQLVFAADIFPPLFFNSTAVSCMNIPDYFFCSDSDSAYCCHEDVFKTPVEFNKLAHKVCSTTCSQLVSNPVSNMTKADQALFLTYAAGLQQNFPRVCPGLFTRPTETSYVLKLSNGGTLYPNVYTEQACYWEIENPLRSGFYIEGLSELTFVLNSTINADIYVF